MSRICEVTGKAGLVGNMVSHSNRKKLMKQLPNLQKKRFYIPEEELRNSASNLPDKSYTKPPKGFLGGVLCILVFSVF